MSSILRPAATIIALTAIVGMLAGCSLLGGVSRDADGRVTEATQIKSTELLADDCFSFIGDGSDLSKVTVQPCGSGHTHKVIGQGTLSSAQVGEAGGLQNAVSASCSESFTAFKASLPEGVKTEQQFLVSSKTVDGVESQLYSCVALDPEVAVDAPVDEGADDTTSSS
ncbi:MAG: hypothetical protein ACOH1J_02275 [Microbacteriaceae bacterium]